MSRIDNIPPEKRGNPDWVKGGPSPNAGGRPKKLVEIERMLDAEHRNLDNMREVFKRLKSLAIDEITSTMVTKKGEVVEMTRPPDPAFMKLYLERVLGPVKEIEADLSDAPPAVLDYLRNLQ